MMRDYSCLKQCVQAFDKGLWSVLWFAVFQQVSQAPQKKDLVMTVIY